MAEKTRYARLGKYYEDGVFGDMSGAAFMVDRKIASTVEAIEEYAETLKERMERLLEKLENNEKLGEEPTTSVNTIGEVQATGAMIDNLLGKLDGLVEVRSLMKYSLERGEEK